jgi:hypothetical protein
MTYDTIEDAFDFVSGAPPCERSALINRITREIGLGCAQSRTRVID